MRADVEEMDGDNHFVHVLVGIGTKKKNTSRSETNSLTAEIRQKCLAGGCQHPSGDGVWGHGYKST